MPPPSDVTGKPSQPARQYRNKQNGSSPASSPQQQIGRAAIDSPGPSKQDARHNQADAKKAHKGRPDKSGEGRHTGFCPSRGNGPDLEWTTHRKPGNSRGIGT